MGTNYIGYALCRVSFYPDRGQVREFFEPGSGRWREQEGRVQGLVVGYCPESCVFQEKRKIPRDVGGTIMEIAQYVKPPDPEPEPKDGRRQRYG